MVPSMIKKCDVRTDKAIQASWTIGMEEEAKQRDAYPQILSTIETA